MTTSRILSSKVEQHTHNVPVVGSTPAGSTSVIMESRVMTARYHYPCFLYQNRSAPGLVPDISPGQAYVFIRILSGTKFVSIRCALANLDLIDLDLVLAQIYPCHDTTIHPGKHP